MRLTRREVVIGAVAAASLARGRVASAQSVSITPVTFDVPPGACDCHVHVHPDPVKFPMFAGRVYTPPTALPEQLAALHQALRLQRVVIVTPSIYGTDNSATLFGMKTRGRDARGVAVIDDKTPDHELEAMQAAGIRGVRLNLATAGISDPAVGRERLQALVKRAQPRNWHVQVNTTLPMIAAVKEVIAAYPVPVVFDHFGGAQAALGTEQPGFADLADLVRSGRAYVKISAAYRASKRRDYSDVAPLAKALIAANADRILWGSDWPHPDPVTPPGKKPTDVTPLLVVDDGRMMNLLASWAPDAAMRHKILVENPARLYGF